MLQCEVQNAVVHSVPSIYSHCLAQVVAIS